MSMDESFPLALPQGTVLAGQYTIEKVLGQGGFGITYRAIDYVTKQKVAVKEFFPDTLAYREMTTVISYPGERSENYAYGKENFLQEAQTLAEFIGNEGIVRIHSYFEENGTAYFVMDYIEGQSFDEYLKEKGGKIGVEEAERILIPVMDALESVHNKGIVHRDVTPDNIYITNDNKVKLLDFGAARYSLGDKSRSLDVILKHGFAPKEQYTRRGKQGPFTDVYSLAATFYFAITGKRPPDSVERLDEDDLVPPGNLGVQITDYQEKALLLALNVQPADRFQSMAAFKKALLDEKTVTKQVLFNAPEPSTAPVAQQVPSAVQQVSPAAQQIPPVPQPEGYPQQNIQPQPIAKQSETVKSKKRSKKLFVAGGILIAAVVLFVGAFALVRGIVSNSRETAARIGREKKLMPAYHKQELLVVGNLPANIKNWGVVTESEGKKFWVDDDYHSIVSLEGYIYQNLEGTFRCLSYYEGTLYFLYNASAYRKDMTTGEQETAIPELKAYSGNIERLYVTTGCYFVYTKDNILYRVSRKTGEKEDEIAISSSYNFTLADGWLYYVGADKDGYSAVFRVRADDFNSVDASISSTNGTMSDLVVEGDYIHLVWKNNERTAARIYRYSSNLVLDEEHDCSWEITALIDPQYFLELNVAEENIFFIGVDDTLYRIIAGSGYDSDYNYEVISSYAELPNVGKSRVSYMAYNAEYEMTVNYYHEF